jgi:hypothetical protein
MKVVLISTVKCGGNGQKKVHVGYVSLHTSFNLREDPSAKGYALLASQTDTNLCHRNTRKTESKYISTDH